MPEVTTATGATSSTPRETRPDAVFAGTHAPGTRRTFAPALHDALTQRFGASISTGRSVRDNHARGESPFLPQAPDAVVFAQTQRDVVDLVRLCARSAPASGLERQCAPRTSLQAGDNTHHE